MANEKIYSKDAVGIKPKLVPDYELLARDDSGGPDWEGYSQQFGDGGYVIGEKAHLSASGGKDDDIEGDEQSENPRTSGYSRTSGSSKDVSPDAPAISKKRAKE